MNKNLASNRQQLADRWEPAYIYTHKASFPCLLWQNSHYLHNFSFDCNEYCPSPRLSLPCSAMICPAWYPEHAHNPYTH